MSWLDKYLDDETGPGPKVPPVRPDATRTPPVLPNFPLRTIGPRDARHAMQPLPQHGALYNGFNGFINFANSTVENFLRDVKERPVRALIESQPEGALALGAKDAIKQSAMGDNKSALFALASLPLLALPGGGEGAPRFFSRLERRIAAAPFEKGTAEQWMAHLSKDVAKGEREWTGIDNFLNQSAGKVLTRAQVKDVFDTGKINLGETVLTQRPRTLEEAKSAAEAAAHQADVAWHTNARQLGLPMLDAMNAQSALWHDTHMPVEDVLKKYDIPRTPHNINVAMGVREGIEAQRAVSREYDAVRPSKYSQYTEPGGTNYREILMQLPGRERSVAEIDKSIDALGEQAIGGPEYQRLMQERIAAQNGTGKDFVSSHFDQPNILAHLRVKDRDLPNKEKALFLEELQSDWHQQGRDKGYATGPASEAELTQARDRLGRAQAAYAQREQELRLQFDTPSSARVPDVQDPELARRGREFVDADQALADLRAGKPGVPDAPFKKTEDWLGLGMKRALDEATRGGYDRLAWTTGAQQADRYNLAKHVDQLAYSPESGYFVARQGSRTVHSGNYDRAALPSVIGKEAAAKLLAATPNSIGIHVLRGDDLAVGGQGMRSFYDQMIPNWLREYGKKLGIPLDVEPMAPAPPPQEMPFDVSGYRVREDASNAYTGQRDVTVLNPEGHMVSVRSGTRRSDEEILADLAKSLTLTPKPNPLANNPSIRITPELRQKILGQGQPLWALLAGAGLGGAALSQQPQQPKPQQQ